MDNYLIYLLIVPVGLFIGIIGSLTGIGGGFLLMPLLLFLFPEKSPQGLTAISMTVVFFNSFSSTIAFARMKTINFKIGILFSLFAFPSVILGNFVLKYFNSKTFSLFFGIFLIIVSIFIFFKSNNNLNKREIPQISKQNLVIMCILSVIAGFISSFFGIGGGIIFVPLFIYFLKYPVINSTSTTQFIISVISLTVIIIDFINNRLILPLELLITIILSVVVGSQFGALFSKKVKGRIVTVILSILLVLVGLKMVFFK